MSVSELSQRPIDLVCFLVLQKKKKKVFSYFKSKVDIRHDFGRKLFSTILGFSWHVCHTFLWHVFVSLYLSIPI